MHRTFVSTLCCALAVGCGTSAGSNSSDSGPGEDSAVDSAAVDSSTHDAAADSASDGSVTPGDCGMLPCFEDLYPHSPLLATIPANPPLDPDDATIVATMFNRPDHLKASASTVASQLSTKSGAFPLYSSTCSDPGSVVSIGQPGWIPNQPAGQTVHFPTGAIPENISDAHITVFDSCASSYGVWDFWSASTPKNDAISAQTGTRMPAYSVPMGCVADKAHYSNCAVDGLGSAEGHAGLASAAVIRGQELVNGAIHHALLFGTMCSAPGNGIYPATAVASDAACPQNGETGPHARYGQRFFLALSDAQIDPLFSSSEAWKKAYWIALAHYGAYISDTGWVTTQWESNLGYLALGKTSPWATLAQQNNLPESGGAWSIDFTPENAASWTTIYQNIHVIATTAPPPVGP